MREKTWAVCLEGLKAEMRAGEKVTLLVVQMVLKRVVMMAEKTAEQMAQ